MHTLFAPLELAQSCRCGLESLSVRVCFQSGPIVDILVVLAARIAFVARSLNRLLSAHRRRDASIDHRILEALERCTLLDLRLLQFAEQFVLEPLQLHALLLVRSDLIRHLLRFHVNFGPRHSSLLLNEVVLLLETLRLGFADLLLAELSIIEILLAHAVQVVFHLFLLAADLLDRGQLLVSEVFVAEKNLLLLLLFSFLHGFFLGFQPRLPLLFFFLLL